MLVRCYAIGMKSLKERNEDAMSAIIAIIEVMRAKGASEKLFLRISKIAQAQIKNIKEAQSKQEA